MVSPGLSPADITQQSSCYALRAGRVFTFNDEVFCRAKTGLEETITGAVKAAPLTRVLQKMPEDEVEVLIEGSDLVIKGKRRAARIHLEAEILLEINKIEKPPQWSKLPEDFGEAIEMVVDSAATNNETNFALTCIHIHPEWVEACDNLQMCRYRTKTGVKQSMLVRRDSIKNVTALGMTEFCETESWIHFRNPAGVILACRRFLESYPDLSPEMNFKGEKAVLPKGLGGACEVASIFSEEYTDNNRVHIDMRPGEVRIKGVGTSGSYSEVKKIKYSGNYMAFSISPKLLENLVKKHVDCELTANKLKVTGPKFTYCVFLYINKAN